MPDKLVEVGVCLMLKLDILGEGIGVGGASPVLQHARLIARHHNVMAPVVLGGGVCMHGVCVWVGRGCRCVCIVCVCVG